MNLSLLEFISFIKDLNSVNPKYWAFSEPFSEDSTDKREIFSFGGVEQMVFF